jgi:hypothetical protein
VEINSRIPAIWSSVTAVIAVCLALAAICATPGAAAASGLASYAVTGDLAPQLHVAGNKLVNQHGQRVVLHGVNRSGGEWACMLNIGIWNGPMGQASVTAIKSWNVNAVRVPLNEACWNGESYADPLDSGAPYRSAVRAYVKLLNRNGLVAILDLAFTDGYYNGPSTQGCITVQARCQKPMPDAKQAIPFWRSVAQAFGRNDSVIFDLFDEPFPQAVMGSGSAAWRCWRNGGSCPGIVYPVVGMQRLVNVVRSAGARNVLMLGGIGWSNDLTHWLAYEPHDPDHNLVASWHSYIGNPCGTLTCWKSQVAPVIAKVPVIAGEIGDQDAYIGPLMAWLDGKSTGYLAWAWNTDANFYAGPSLITSYSGTPTSYGAGYRAHLRSLRDLSTRLRPGPSLP